uniref:Secreted frizzled-related protein 5 n=1 Tax=Gasterosteus aculeatus aculeatus TaxID=481459 RepID=G3NXV6_GASAC
MAHGQKSPRWALTQGSFSLAPGSSLFSLLLLLLLFLAVSAADEYDYYSWQSDNFHNGRFYTKQPQCVDIPADLRLCHNVGYKKMRLPNLLDHETMPEVKQQAGSWVPLLAKRCHADTQVFLCSLFAPVCLDRPIYPCRSLCEAVRDSCAPVMETYGFPWPEMLTCDKFPIDNDLCIPMQFTGNHATQPPVSKVCPPCDNELKADNIMEHYCASDFALKMKIKEVKKEKGDRKLIARPKEEEGPEETDPVHQERRQLPVRPARQPGVQLPHHGPQSGPAAAAHVHSQVGQEEQGAQVCDQVHEVSPVSHLPHRLPVTRPVRPDILTLSHVGPNSVSLIPGPLQNILPAPLRSLTLGKQGRRACVFSALTSIKSSRGPS